MVCLSSKNWSQPRPLASVSWLISLCRGISAVIQDGRPKTSVLWKVSCLVLQPGPHQGALSCHTQQSCPRLCSNIRTLRDKLYIFRGKALLLAAQEHKPEANHQEILRITDGGAGRNAAVQLRLQRKITPWRTQRLSVHILTPPETSLVAGLNQLIKPLFLTNVPHLDHLFPDG